MSVKTTVYIRDTVVGVGVWMEKYPCGTASSSPSTIARHVIRPRTVSPKTPAPSFVAASLSGGRLAVKVTAFRGSRA